MKTKKPKKAGKLKKKSSLFRSSVAILWIFFVMLSGALITVYFHNHKRYDPALENKLDQKSIPSDVKKAVAQASPSANFRVPVLLYHYVEYVKDKRDTIRQSLDTSPYTLEQQIIALKNADYTFMTASQLGKVLDGEMPMPRNPILLTFDDGHWDLFTDVLPILKKYNVKVTAYIIPGFLGGSDFLSHDQVQELQDSGLVEIGAHTVHHIYLKKQPLKRVQDEVDNSKTMLQDEFHIHVVSFAYPYGAFDKQAIDVVKSAGFTTSMSTLPGIIVNQSDRYFIERIRPGGRIGDNLINFLTTYQQPPQTSTVAQD